MDAKHPRPVSSRREAIKHKKKKRAQLRFFVTLFIIIVFIVLSVVLSRLPKFQIQNITIDGIVVGSESETRGVIENVLEGTYLGLYPRRNILLYPKKKIMRALEEEFPRLYQSSLKRSGFHTLRLSTKERSPKFLWCGSVPPHEGAHTNDCYFADEQGYIFGHAPVFSGTVFFIFYKTLPTEDPLRQYIFSDSEFKQLIKFKERLEQIGIPTHAFAFYDGMEAFLTRADGIDASGQIRFLPDADPDLIISNLGTALSTEKLGEGLKNNWATLDYIDLRYENKVYYKFLH